MIFIVLYHYEALLHFLMIVGALPASPVCLLLELTPFVSNWTRLPGIFFFFFYIVIFFTSPFEQHKNLH